MMGRFIERDQDISDDEKAAVDEVILSLPAAMRRRSIVYGSSKLSSIMEEMKTSGDLDRLDKLIVDTLSHLKGKVPQNVAEKLFDRMHSLEYTDEEIENRGATGVFLHRLHDTWECMLAIGKTFRGKELNSIYGKMYATEQLKLRGVLPR